MAITSKKSQKLSNFGNFLRLFFKRVPVFVKGGPCAMAQWHNGQPNSGPATLLASILWMVKTFLLSADGQKYSNYKQTIAKVKQFA